MLPRKLPPSSHHEDTDEYAGEGSSQRYDTVGGIAEAQECTEVSGWSKAPCGCKKSHCTNCRRRTERTNNIENGSKDLARVGLLKSPSLDYEPNKFYVRAAGGMSIPVPVSKMSYENDKHHQLSSVHSVPQLDDGSLDMAQTSGDDPSGNLGKKSSNYLPLSVELVAGRGTTSIPSDGNKNTSGSAKVKSVPPSRTLAMSASLFKNYLIPSDKTQSKASAAPPDTENSVKTKMMGIWNNVKYGKTLNVTT